MNKIGLIGALMPLLCDESAWDKIPVEPKTTRKVRFCDYCENLNPKEYEQSSAKLPHVCTKHNKQVYHCGFHPKIVRCKECEDV